MNRTINDATVKCSHDDNRDQLRRHLADFIAAYNFVRRLETMKDLSPCEVVCKPWTAEPDRFMLRSLQPILRLNIQPA